MSLRLEALHEHIQRDLGVDTARTGRYCGSVLDNTTHEAHAAELERKIAALGPVNPLALEELSSLEERHKELEVQVDDVRAAAP